MAVVAALVVLLAGLGLLVQAARADLAARRWTRTRGTIREATKAHLSDDGRRWWNLRVSYRGPMGEEHDGRVRTLWDDTDRLAGDVDVWYDPRRPDRCRVALGPDGPGSSRLQYLLGLALLVGGAVVLAVALA